MSDDTLDLEFMTMQLLTKLSDKTLSDAAQIFIHNNSQHIPTAFGLLITEMARRLSEQGG
jgi:hypothetical protein